MEPKGRLTHLVGSARTIVFIVRAAYGEVSGSLREATFSRLRPRTPFGSVSESIFDDFRRFGMSFGGPWGTILESKMRPVAGSNFGHLWNLN